MVTPIPNGIPPQMRRQYYADQLFAQLQRNNEINYGKYIFQFDCNKTDCNKKVLTTGKN